MDGSRICILLYSPLMQRSFNLLSILKVRNASAYLVCRLKSNFMTTQYFSVFLNNCLLKQSVSFLFWAWIIAHVMQVNLKCEPIVVAKESGLLDLEVFRRGNTDGCGKFKGLENPLRSLILQKYSPCYLTLLQTSNPPHSLDPQCSVNQDSCPLPYQPAPLYKQSLDIFNFRAGCPVEGLPLVVSD